MSRSTSHDKSFQPLRNKSKRKKDPCEELLETVNNKLQDEKNDEFDVIGQNVAHKLRNLPREVKIISEKFINDILFESEMGNINKYTKMLLQQCQPLEPLRTFQLHTPYETHTSLQSQSSHPFQTQTQSDTPHFSQTPQLIHNPHITQQSQQNINQDLGSSPTTDLHSFYAGYKP